MTEVIKISKQGINVGTATNPNDFIFDSTLNTFKIVSQGTLLGTLGSVPGTVSFAHGLSYTPLVNGFVRRNTRTDAIGVSQGDYFESKGFSYSNQTLSSVSADGTNIHFEIADSAGTYSLSYFCFEIPLS